MAVSMLLCMSMVAFADGQAYNVTTTYDGTNVTVTTSVSGAVPSEQVAFLVEKGEDIIWIDQKPADNSGAAASVFTDTVADAVGATVKVGTASFAANSFGAVKSIALPNYTVTWTVEGSAKAIVTAVADAAEETDGNVSTSRTVTFYVAAPANEKLVAINGDAPSIIGNAITYNVSADTAFTFTFAAKDVATAPEPTVPSQEVAAVTEVEGAKTAGVTATVTDAVEFGLLVAKKGTADLTAVTSLDGLGYDSALIRKYEALGANSFGQFVIQLQDTNGVFFVDDIKYEACVYALGSTLTLGDVFDLN